MGYLYNTCYGGFSLSNECIERYKKDTGEEIESCDTLIRSDTLLIMYFVYEYDGMETVSVSMDKDKQLSNDFFMSVEDDESNLYDIYRWFKEEYDAERDKN